MSDPRWASTRLGDEVDLLTGYPFQSKDYSESPDSIRLLRGDNVVQGSLRWDGMKRWPQSKASEVASYRLVEGDVVLAMDRPWIEAGLKFAAISREDLPCFLVQRVARLRGGPRLDTGFLRYLIGSKEFTDHVLAVQTGTAVPHISGGQIKAFQFLRPPKATQERIAAILGSLDDKIELNRRTNKTLEAMACAVFQSWFVDFDPVRAKVDGRKPEAMDAATAKMFPEKFEKSSLGLVPKGWRVGRLEEVLAEIETGSRPKGGVGEIKSGIPSIGAESINGLGYFDYSKTKFVSHDFFQNMTKGHIRSRDVLLYKDGGRPGMFEPHVAMFGDGFPFEKCCINEHVYRLRTNQLSNQTYLYFWLTTDSASAEMRVKPERHHDFIDVADFPLCWRRKNITVEVEAKAKEVAVKKLKSDLEPNPKKVRNKA